MNEFQIIARSLKDFFTIEMLKFTLIPFLATFVIIYLMFFAAAEHLSRGQKKLVVSALKLAQGQLYAAQRGQPCVYLIDDLPAV